MKRERGRHGNKTRKARKSNHLFRAFRVLISVSSAFSLLLTAAFAFSGAFSGTFSGTWQPAMRGYEIDFPRDHANHPDKKIEWWYYTGNLQAKDGRRFGYQLTFFRVGVDFQPVNPSRWAVRDLFMAHLAVSDIDNKRFHFAERLNRAGIDGAGATADAYRVWNEDWEARLDDRGRHLLKARDGAFGIELELERGKPPVLHGEKGYSQKGASPDNASHYYSLTRMPARGAIVIDGERIEVEGASWMDHEFGSSFLEPNQVGWDWFSIQLDDGLDLMFYEFKRNDGGRDPRSGGTLVGADGKTTAIRGEEVTLERRRFWRSAVTGASYPVEWRLQIPSRGIDLVVRAAIENQELNTAQSTGVVYWEGAIEISGTREGRSVRGRGYLEMTGYSGMTLDRVLN